jgi:hypothetical protein
MKNSRYNILICCKQHSRQLIIWKKLSMTKICAPFCLVLFSNKMREGGRIAYLPMLLNVEIEQLFDIPFDIYIFFFHLMYFRFEQLPGPILNPPQRLHCIVTFVLALLIVA